jgi:hypothetical protein
MIMKLRVVLIAAVFVVPTIIAGCSKRMPQAGAAEQTQTPSASKQIVLPGGTAALESVQKEKSQEEKYIVLKTPVPQPNEFQEFVPLKRQPQEITLTCTRIDSAPVIDGLADEPAWTQAQAITTLDFSSQRPIELRSFHDEQNIYVLAKYPDGAPSETHKSWFWDYNEKVYKPGMDREDMFIVKWLMTGDSPYLAADKAAPHTADVWFWKAARTNPSGYVDDKMDIVRIEDGKDSFTLKSDKYGTLYLFRPADKGNSAYTEVMVFEYCGQCISKFVPAIPDGSRADIRGKGVWKDGFWTIEMSRKLNTGHDDDIAFAPGGKYRFAATVYEMAGAGIEKDWWQPMYRTGDAFDILTLDMQ